MKFFKRKKLFRFFLRSGEHVDVRGTDVKLKFKTDHYTFTSYEVENPDRYFHILLTEIVAVSRIK